MKSTDIKVFYMDIKSKLSTFRFAMFNNILLFLLVRFYTGKIWSRD